MDWTGRRGRADGASKREVKPQLAQPTSSRRPPAGGSKRLVFVYPFLNTSESPEKVSHQRRLPFLLFPVYYPPRIRVSHIRQNKKGL